MTQRAPLKAYLADYSESNFTNPHDVVRADEAVSHLGRFTPMGAQYDGFETSRGKAWRFENGLWMYNHGAHHHLDIGLYERAAIDRVDVSTKWFTGNNVEEVAVYLRDRFNPAAEDVCVIERTKLQPDAMNSFVLDTPVPATACFVKAYSEGGISRVQLYGEASAQQPFSPANLLERATILALSNDHYGGPDRTFTGKREQDFMFGWESARTGRGEFVLCALDEASTIDGVVVDTYLHRQNATPQAAVYGLSASFNAGHDAEDLLADAPRYRMSFADGSSVIPHDLTQFMRSNEFAERLRASGAQQVHIESVRPAGSRWKTILPPSSIKADCFNAFGSERMEGTGEAYSHLLVQHGPNGGIHGLKAFGNMSEMDRKTFLPTPLS